MDMQVEREIWLDWMRVAACLMVMVVHATEPFYLGGDGSLILTQTDAFWASFFDSFVRACVPLFIIASSYLQFPLHYSSEEFFRRRAVRILVPFVLWTVVYAERVGRTELRIYLGLWLFTTVIPLLRDWVFGAPPVVYGVSGLPRQALFPLWGEASWNAYGVFYYLSGFVGYLLLGLYVRKFLGTWSWRKTLAVALPCFAAGFALSFGGFLRRVWLSSGGEFPVGGLVEKAVWWETTWCNDTLGVALMAIAWVLLFRKIQAAGGFYRRITLPLSRAGYGMYLSHLLVLVPICTWVRGWLGSGDAGILGFWTTPAEITLSAVACFVVVGAGSIALQRIPKVGKFIMG